MKEYIARFGHGSSKLARQAQSKEKVLAKMVAEGLTQKPDMDFCAKIRFTVPLSTSNPSQSRAPACRHAAAPLRDTRVRRPCG